MISDSAKPVAQFRPADVVVEAWAESENAVFWDPGRTRKRRRDGTQVCEQEVSDELPALDDELGDSDDDSERAAGLADDSGDAWADDASAEEADQIKFTVLLCLQQFENQPVAICSIRQRVRNCLLLMFA